METSPSGPAVAAYLAVFKGQSRVHTESDLWGYLVWCECGQLDPFGGDPIAARHADPRTTMRYDRARKNLDRHPNYILAAYMASGT